MLKIPVVVCLEGTKVIRKEHNLTLLFNLLSELAPTAIGGGGGDIGKKINHGGEISLGDAVLNEWQRTMTNLPAGFQKAYDMIYMKLQES
nr:hypothetical protein CFP56_04771 [Quercus suber]